MKKHAYLIMAYNEFHMLKKLLAELDDERNDIYIHIDKKTKYVDLDEIAAWITKSRVFFVERMNIYWGHLSMVECELRLLEAALKGNYHYYHLISGSDFPLKTQDEIHSLLENEDGLFVKYHLDGEDGDYFLYKLKLYHPFIRFVGKGIHPGAGKKQALKRMMGEWQKKLIKLEEDRGVNRLKGTEIQYKGTQWFSITHDFAAYILENKDRIIKKYRMTNGPDEFFVPTLAMNSDFRDRVRNDDLREIDWDRGSPYEYTIEDLELLKSSDAFFARKISFDNNPDLADALTDHLHATAKAPDAPLISIVVPCYNVEMYVSECIDSLVSQTYPNLEILLINDGSTDGTLDKLKEYSERYGNIHVHCRENGGLSAARNTGIEHAKGEYIAFVDSDDWVEPLYIEKLYAAIREGNTDMSVCGYLKEEMEEGVVTFDKAQILSSHKAMRILGDIYPKENVLMVIAWNKLYKKSLFKHERYPEGKIHEDEYLAHRIIGQALSVSTITDALYHYRVRAGSITTTGKEQNLKRLDYLDALKDRLEYCRVMTYGDIFIYMLYSFFEGLKQLMATFSDETFNKKGLRRYFRKEACSVYFGHYGELDSYQRKDYMKLILFPGHYRKNVIRALNEKNSN